MHHQRTADARRALAVVTFAVRRAGRSRAETLRILRRGDIARPLDPQYALSAASLAVLETELDAKGRRIKVHKLPLPKPVTITAEECEGLDLCEGEPTRTPGERLAASYVNFYIANHAIVMPAFGDPADERAQEILRKLFPTREIVAIPARDILIGGGNIHCITQQIPKK